MYNKIIIASALDQGFSEKALETAKILISENGEIILVHVMEPINNVAQSFVTDEIQSKTHDKIKSMMAERINDESIEKLDSAKNRN